MGRVYGIQTKTPETEVPGVSILDNLAIHADIVFSGRFGLPSLRLAPLLLLASPALGQLCGLRLQLDPWAFPRPTFLACAWRPALVPLWVWILACASFRVLRCAFDSRLPACAVP